jgi:hypothetical protein
MIPFDRFPKIISVSEPFWSSVSWLEVLLLLRSDSYFFASSIEFSKWAINVKFDAKEL